MNAVKAPRKLDMRLQVDVTEEIKQWLKIRAVKTGSTMSEMVQQALEDYREKVEQPAGKSSK